MRIKNYLMSAFASVALMGQVNAQTIHDFNGYPAIWGASLWDDGSLGIEMVDGDQALKAVVSADDGAWTEKLFSVPCDLTITKDETVSVSAKVKPMGATAPVTYYYRIDDADGNVLAQSLGMSLGLPQWVDITFNDVPAAASGQAASINIAVNYAEAAPTAAILGTYYYDDIAINGTVVGDFEALPANMQVNLGGAVKFDFSLEQQGGSMAAKIDFEQKSGGEWWENGALQFNTNVALEAGTDYIYSAKVKSTVTEAPIYFKLTKSDGAAIAEGKVTIPATVNAGEWATIGLPFTSDGDDAATVYLYCMNASEAGGNSVDGVYYFDDVTVAEFVLPPSAPEFNEPAVFVTYYNESGERVDTEFTSDTIVTALGAAAVKYQAWAWDANGTMDYDETTYADLGVINFSVLNVPAELTVTVEEDGGPWVDNSLYTAYYTIDPSAAPAGTYTFDVVVTDETALADTATITYIVNAAPEFNDVVFVKYYDESGERVETGFTSNEIVVEEGSSIKYQAWAWDANKTMDYDETTFADLGIINFTAANVPSELTVTIEEDGGPWAVPPTEDLYTAYYTVDASSAPVGNYSFDVVITDEYGEADTVTISYEVEPATAIHDQLTTEFNIYPNPVIDGRISIELPSSEETAISIYDISGKVVFTKSVKGNFSENLNLTNGLYLVKAVNDNTTVVKRVIVK